MTEFNRIVSVPLQGTYLPYDTMKLVKAFGKTFPSPCRGLIFLTKMLLHLKSMVKWFPSPCRGLIFLTELLRETTEENQTFPSPCRGLIFLTRTKTFNQYFGVRVSVPLQGTYLPYGNKMKKKFNTRQGFRPLAGDLSSLPEDTKEAFTSWDAFPSPCRGLIFLTDGDRYQTYFYDGFRPLAGDLSSLRIWSERKRHTIMVSVPLQGTYLPYQ